MGSSLEFTPEEIRATRRQLGLSQVEAGQLIGGGPRAFSKYEAGTVRPAASVISLLRILQADPTALATLRGQEPRPIEPGTAAPFEVSGRYLALLTDKTFPELLRRLLHAEAQANDLPADGIHVASNVSAADGGEDGRIEWKDGLDRTRFLPSRLCLFQLKAGKITPSTAARDVVTKERTVKVMVRGVLEADGNYIMLCSRPYTQKQIEKRKASLQAALCAAGMAIDIGQVDFWDADQIAMWVNHHSTVAMWVMEQTPSGTIHPFRSWTHWAGRPEHERSPWVEDERLPTLRAYLHEEIKKHRSFVRIVGPAGVGKSRLTLEALGSAVGDGATDRFLSDIVLYSVQSEAHVEDIYKVVQDLAGSGARAVVVVDQCEPEARQTLVGMTSRRSSCLSLVTIDDEIPTGTLGQDTFKIDEATASVTEAIINQVSPDLPSEDRERLVRFSKGFPKIAILVGQAWNKSIPIAHATDDALVDTFVLGRRPRDRALLLKSATLVAAFGLVEAVCTEGQLSEVARLGRDLSAEDLYAAVTDLIERGAARRRGRLVSLQPRPISLSLAERQWKEWDPAKWDQVLTGDISPEVRAMAARQLALLNTTKVSQRVVNNVCRPGGPFEGYAALSKPGNPEVLSTLAAIDSKAVVDQINRSLLHVRDLSSVTGDVRRHLVYALEKICFHTHTFEEGARLLLRLAMAENEEWANNATGLFLGLFPMFLGGTAADGKSRLSFLDDATASDDEVQRLLAARGMIAGARTSHFTRVVGAETQGSLPALDPWRPATNEEANHYLEGCVRRLARIAKVDDKVGLAAREGLGKSLRPLILTGLFDLVETVVEQVSTVVSYWPDAVTSLRNTLTHDTERIDAEVCSRVSKLFVDLQPESLQSRLRALVTEMSWDHLMDEEPDYEKRFRRQVEAVRELASELLEQPATLSRALPDLSCGEQRMAGELGVALAELDDSPLKWLDPIAQAVVQTPENERSYDLLTGFVVGLAKSHPEAVAAFKQRVARSSDLAPSLPQICFPLGISASDIELAIGALQSGLLPAWRLNKWSFGGVLAKVPASEVAPLFDVMLEHSAEAYVVAVDLMGMYAHGEPEKLEGLRPQVLKLVENLTKWERLPSGDMHLHHFEQIAGWILGKGRQDPDATAAALALARALANSEEFGGKSAIEPLLSNLLSGFPEVAWQLIGQAIVSDDRKAELLTFVLGDQFSFERESCPPILSLSEDALFAWCHAHPDRAPAFVARILPLLTTRGADAPNLSLHPITARLLDEFGEREDVRLSVERNVYTFGWSGSRTTYFARYKEPFSKLLQHPKQGVRSWARNVLRNLDDSVQMARNEDEETEARGELW